MRAYLSIARIALLWLLLVAHGVAAEHAPKTGIPGDWLTPGADALVRIAVVDEAASITLLATRDATLTDANNPRPAQRARTLANIVLGRKFKLQGEVWRGGSLYDPSSGKTYRATLRLLATGALEVRGYVGLPAFGRTQTWTRLADFEAALASMVAKAGRHE